MGGKREGAGRLGRRRVKRPFTPSSPPRRSWKCSGGGRQGAGAGGEAPTLAAATRFPEPSLKGCSDPSERPRRRLPPPRGRCVPGRRCHLHFARLLGRGWGCRPVVRPLGKKDCQGALPEALRALLLQIPGDCAGSGVEVRGVWPGPHSWEGGRRHRKRSELPAGLTYPALSLPGLVFFCFESSCSLSRGNLGRRSPATVRVLGALWGRRETLWLRAGRP